MIRLPIEAARIAPTLELTRTERHYLCDVLRLVPGDRFEVFDRQGGRYPAELCEEDRLKLGERLAQSSSAAPITLAQALAKGEKMELVVQKATELGATGIAPFSCERAIVKLDERRAEERVSRWARIAAAAASQCGRADVPRVWPITGLEEMIRLGLERQELPVLLYEKERDLRLSQAVGEAPGPLLLIVGPEGGFTEAEVEQARQLGARIATLGQRVLRTETVALAALSVVQVLAGELG